MRPTFTTTCLPEDPQQITRYDLGGHTHYKLDYHFVWRTKFNRRLLGPILAPFLVSEIDTICRDKNVKRLGLAIAVNHVHLCARLRPSQSPAQVMRWIKATTSKMAFESFPELACASVCAIFGAVAITSRASATRTSLRYWRIWAVKTTNTTCAALESSLAEIDAFLRKVDDDDEGDDDDLEG